MGGLLGDIFGTARDIRRGTREIGGVFREVGRTSDEIARARGAVEGHGGVKDEAEYRREERGDRSFSRAARARAEREAIENGNDDRDDRRGDFIRDPRRAGLGSAQRDDGYEAPSRDRMEQATKDYVFALADAALSPAGSPERALAIKEARDILTNPQNGLMPDGPEGAVRFPEGMRVVLDGRGRDARGIHFEGMYSRAPSADESIRRGVSAVVDKGIGSPLTDADLAALRGATAPTVAVGTGEQPNPTTPDAPAPGAGADAATPAPQSSAPRVLAEPKNGMPQMKMTKEEVIDLQTKLMTMPGFEEEAKAMKARGGADGKPGSATYAAFSKLGSLMNPPLRAEEIDMSNPEIVAKVNAVIEAKTTGKSAAVDGQSASAATPAAGAGQGAAPSSPPVGHADHSAESLDKAVRVLTLIAGDDKHIGSADIKRFATDAAGIEAVARVYDLNQDGKVAQSEMDKIVAAANKANGVTIEGGAPALNALFANASFASAQPATDVASVDSPAPSQGQTAQVNPQTGEVTPPAAAPATAQLNLNDVGPPPATPAGNPALQRDNAMAGSRA